MHWFGLLLVPVGLGVAATRPGWWLRIDWRGPLTLSWRLAADWWTDIELHWSGWSGPLTEGDVR